MLKARYYFPKFSFYKTVMTRNGKDYEHILSVNLPLFCFTLACVELYHKIFIHIQKAPCLLFWPCLHSKTIPY